MRWLVYIPILAALAAPPSDETAIEAFEHELQQLKPIEWPTWDLQEVTEEEESTEEDEEEEEETTTTTTTKKKTTTTTKKKTTTTTTTTTSTTTSSLPSPQALLKALGESDEIRGAQPERADMTTRGLMNKQDWIIAKPVQDSLSSFAALNWQIKDTQSIIDDLKTQIEHYDDALAEFDLEGSFLQVGETFQLIEDYSNAVAEIELRQRECETNMDNAKSKLAEFEAESSSRKRIIEAALGDRVRLNM